MFAFAPDWIEGEPLPSTLRRRADEKLSILSIFAFAKISKISNFTALFFFGTVRSVRYGLRVVPAAWRPRPGVLGRVSGDVTQFAGIVRLKG